MTLKQQQLLENKVRKIVEQVLTEESWADAQSRVGLPDGFFDNESISFFQHFHNSLEDILNWKAMHKSADYETFRKIDKLYKSTKTYKAII